jgi:hypothetical protein
MSPKNDKPCSCSGTLTADLLYLTCPFSRTHSCGTVPDFHRLPAISIVKYGNNTTEQRYMYGVILPTTLISGDTLLQVAKTGNKALGGTFET